MANEFKIVISATDRATASIRKINNSISRMTRPFENVRRSFGALGREIGKNPIARVLSGIGRAAVSVSVGIASILAPMAALVGLGSVAAMYALVTEWGRLGFEIKNTAAGLDMATSSLQSFRGAAQLAGVSSEELTGGLKAVGDTMQDALYGRNQSALMLLNRLGVSIKKTGDGSIDAAAGFKDLATAISNIKSVQVQGLIARQFGLEASLPLLRKGAAGIEELQRKFEALGGVRSNASIDIAARFGESLIQMNTALTSLRIEIGSALLPVLQPVIEQFTQFIALNRVKIGDQIKSWVERFTAWVQSDDFDKLIGNLERVGGVLMYLIEKVGDLVLAMSKLSAQNPAKYVVGGVPRLIWDLIKGGDDEKKVAAPGMPAIRQTVAPPSPGIASANQAATGATRGIRNNNPGNLNYVGQDGAVKESGPNGRFAVFKSPEAGVEAMARQLQLYGARGIDTLSGIISKWAPPSDNNNTAGYIKAVSADTKLDPNAKLDLNDKKTLAPLISSMIRQEGNSAGFSQEMIDKAVSHVMVEFKNAPPGTTASAKTRQGAEAPVRINHSLPTLAAG